MDKIRDSFTSPTPDGKPIHAALSHLSDSIAQLDERTQQLEKQLQDILQPPNPTPREEEDKEPTNTSTITNAICLNVKAISTIVIRIEQILARLEI